jgi:hypothetical protein
MSYMGRERAKSVRADEVRKLALVSPYESMTGPIDQPAAAHGILLTSVLKWCRGTATSWTPPTTSVGAVVVNKLILGCTYACNTSTLRERLECKVFAALLRISSPATLAKLIVRPSKSKPTGAIGLTRQQAEWLRTIMSANPASAMRGAVRGLITFDSRSWLKEIH